MASALAPAPRRLTLLLLLLGAVLVLLRLSRSGPSLSSLAKPVGSWPLVATSFAEQQQPRAASGRAVPFGWAGVQQFSLPIEFNRTYVPADAVAPKEGSLSGVVHIFAKAVRWADGHLRLKGVVFFEPTRFPDWWEPIMYHVPARNVPELLFGLRLGVRSMSGGWAREVELRVSMCADQARQEGAEFERKFQGCADQMHLHIGKAYMDFADLSVDFGPTQSVDYELFVYDWPRFIDLAGLLAGAATQQPAAAGAQPQVVKVAAYLMAHRELDAAVAARIIQWQVEHHLAIGFTGLVQWVYPMHAEVLQQNPTIQALIRAGHLTLALWQPVSIWENWYNFEMQLSLSVGVLCFWGRSPKAFVLAADLDEFLIPAHRGDTLPTMLTRGCLSRWPQCLRFKGRAVFPHEGAQLNEAELWRVDGPNPLSLHYHGFTTGGGFQKTLADADVAFPMAVHLTSVCAGEGDVADNSTTAKLRSPCAQVVACTVVSESCAWIAHVVNMHKARGKPQNTTKLPHGWMWMAGPKAALPHSTGAAGAGAGGAAAGSGRGELPPGANP